MWGQKDYLVQVVYSSVTFGVEISKLAISLS